MRRYINPLPLGMEIWIFFKAFYLVVSGACRLNVFLVNSRDGLQKLSHHDIYSLY